MGQVRLGTDSIVIAGNKSNYAKNNLWVILIDASRSLFGLVPETSHSVRPSAKEKGPIEGETFAVQFPVTSQD